jgi:hypothetical protein
MTTTTGITAAGPSDFVQRLFKHADANHDGQVSPAEFQAFLAGALNHSSTATTSADRQAFMALAQNMPATSANLQQIARTLGPGVGHVEADGSTYALGDSTGSIGIRNLGRGPEWQWLAPTTGASR